MENYLRTHFGYTLELPPSEPEDPLAFFLFHRKKGHCEYFASAMAVMLRVVRDSVSRGDRFSKRDLQSDQRHAIDPHFGRSQLGGSLASRPRLDNFRSHAARSQSAELSMWTRLGFYTDAAEVFWQDWVLNYDLDHQLQLASKMGRSGRQMGTNWWDGSGFSVPRWSRSVLQFGERYGFVLLGIAMLAILGRCVWTRWLALVENPPAGSKSPARRGAGLRCHAAVPPHAESAASPRNREAGLADAVRVRARGPRTRTVSA